MYVSGHGKISPRSAIGMIDSAPAPPVAQMLAPSSASSATSMASPPAPIRSPTYRAVDLALAALADADRRIDLDRIEGAPHRRAGGAIDAGLVAAAHADAPTRAPPPR